MVRRCARCAPELESAGDWRATAAGDGAAGAPARLCDRSATSCGRKPASAGVLSPSAISRHRANDTLSTAVSSHDQSDRSYKRRYVRLILAKFAIILSNGMTSISLLGLLPV